MPKNWTIVENEMEQTEGMLSSAYSLKGPNTEIYAGMKVSIISRKVDENRVLNISIFSLDNSETISKEEFEQSIIFATQLHGGL